MRKLLVALMIVAFAATAFADVTLSGTYKARGNYMSNMQTPMVDSDDDSSMYYDHDLDLWLKANTDKDTFFNMKVEMLDGQWKEAVADANGDPTVPATKTGDEIQVERAWLGHNFGVAKLEVGIMDGAGWSYGFGNTVDGYYRIKATVPAGPGSVIALVQKNYEASLFSTADDAEKDDSDTYFVGYKAKIGGLMLTPSISYIMDGSTQKLDEEVDTKTTKFDMGIGGNFGAIGFESEIIYVNKDVESGDDIKTYGLYANVFTKVDAATVGFITAYASVDDDTDTGFNMGEDFDDMYFLVLGDNEAYGTGLPGLWGNVLYADYAVNEKLNVYGSVAYAMSNYDDDVLDMTAYEVDLGLTYKITSALSYGADFGYAAADIDGVDTDPFIVAQHYLKISF